MPTRRAVLLGGAGVVAAGAIGVGAGIERGVLPGRPFLQSHLGLNGADGAIPDIEPGPVLEDSFASAARGGIEVGWALLLPPDAGTDPLHVVVALHGLGADHATLTGPQFGLDRFLAQHVADGGTPFAIATVDGGRGYWHPHDGDDAGQMVLDELFPRIAQSGHHIVAPPIGFLGWSMGGYGALRLAGLMGAGAATAVVASSPALWTDPSEASPDGFADVDDYAEYTEYTAFDQRDRLSGIAVRIDCGTGDPFYRATQEYAEGLPPVADELSVHEVTFEPGGHTPGYWRRMLPAQLSFLGTYV